MVISKQRILRNLSKIIKFYLSKTNNKINPRSILFILGYGRSGTTIITSLLKHLIYVDVHGESSTKIMQNFQINYEKFDKLIKRNRFEIIALKPILNSCDIDFLLKNYENSKVLWLFRDYNDVTFSGLLKFGDNVSNELKDYITETKSDGWIANQIKLKEIEIIKKLNYNTFNKNDWMALVWWFVNNYFVRTKMYNNTNVLTFEYNDFVNDSEFYFDQINKHIGLKKHNLHLYIDNKRVGKGKEIILDPKVKEMCDSVLKSLRKIKLKNN